jgi:hypothetical protein
MVNTLLLVHRCEVTVSVLLEHAIEPTRVKGICLSIGPSTARRKANDESAVAPLLAELLAVPTGEHAVGVFCVHLQKCNPSALPNLAWAVSAANRQVQQPRRR